MLRGYTQDCKATKHSIKAAKGGKGEKDDDEVRSDAGDDGDEVEAKSAALSMGQKLQI